MDIPDPVAERIYRIGLNAQLLSTRASYRSAGVSRYVQGLLRYLPGVDPAMCYLAFLGAGEGQFPGWSTRVSRWRTERPWARIAWEQVAQPWHARRERLDLLHVPVYVGPLVAPCPVVVTILDLSFYLYPELFRPLNRIYLQTFTRLTVQRAAHVIAISESTRADMLRLLGVPGDRVTAIPPGVDETLHPIADPAQVAAFRQRRALPEHTILCLATLEPRKNITTLLEAYALLRQRPGFQHRLVVAGGKGWYYEQIEATVERLGLREAVLFPGYVPQEELALWYNAADVFVYPSLYEGFGLPPLEAMACGTPVVVSNASSLPEVVGEAGLAVDPHDARALAAAIEAVLGDPARQGALRAAGLARARAFAWRATAHKTARLYRRILGAEPSHGA